MAPAYSLGLYCWRSLILKSDVCSKAVYLVSKANQLCLFLQRLQCAAAIAGTTLNRVREQAAAMAARPILVR